MVGQEKQFSAIERENGPLKRAVQKCKLEVENGLPHLRKVRKQVARPDGKRLRQFHNVLKGDIPLTALDPADIIPV